MDDKISISKMEYATLIRDQKFLYELYAAGVDNWEGYPGEADPDNWEEEED